MIVYHSHSILAPICKLKNKAKAAPIKAAPIKAAPIKAASIKAAPTNTTQLKAASSKTKVQKCSKTAKHTRGKNVKLQTTLYNRS